MNLHPFRYLAEIVPPADSAVVAFQSSYIEEKEEVT